MSSRVLSVHMSDSVQQLFPAQPDFCVLLRETLQKKTTLRQSVWALPQKPVLIWRTCYTFVGNERLDGLGSVCGRPSGKCGRNPGPFRTSGHSRPPDNCRNRRRSLLLSLGSGGSGSARSNSHPSCSVPPARPWSWAISAKRISRRLFS